MWHALLLTAFLSCTSGAADRPLDEAREALASPRRQERAAAVRRLARLADEGAWRLVAGALADPEGTVAEAAEEALGRASTPFVAELLAGRAGLRSSDPHVAARAARALGRSSASPPVRALLRAAGARDEELRCAALLAIERHASAGRWPRGGEGFDAVARLVRRGPTDRVRARALHALLALDAERTIPEVRRALVSRHDGLRAAACVPAVRLLPVGERWTALRALLVDAAWPVRLAALEAAIVLATPAAVPVLIERMEADPRPRVRHRALRALCELSGLRHGPDPRPWRDWAATLEENGLPVPSRSAAARDAGPRERTLALERVELHSDHVAFLIDLSGSMWSRHGAVSRKEVVDQRFGALLERLDPATRFLLVPYTNRPHPWEERPQAATKRNVARARRFFTGCTERGSGDFWEAALLALEHADIDTLVVLTDGVPTGGDYNRMELVAEVFRARNLSRRVTVDALLIHPSAGALRSWGAFCAGTGGTCIPVDLDG